MSFLNFMKRMVEGKPVFEDAAQAEQPQVEVPSQSAIRKGVDSSFPVVYVKHTKTNLNGDKMDVYCQILNTWSEQVMLDKIRIAGATRELDTSLRGGEEREFLVYRGPKLRQEHFEAELDYKTEREGDYFRAVHDVTWTYRSDDKTYEINEVRLRHPILDIYG